MKQMGCQMILIFFIRSTMFSICISKRRFKSKLSARCILILFIVVIGKCLHLTARDIPAGTHSIIFFLKKFSYFYLYSVDQDNLQQ